MKKTNDFQPAADADTTARFNELVDEGMPVYLIAQELDIDPYVAAKLYVSYKIDGGRQKQQLLKERLTDEGKKAYDVWTKLNSYQGKNCGLRYCWR